MRVEKFVIFDTIPFPRGKGWDSRVKILLGGNEFWLTMPIRKSGSSTSRTYQVEMISPEYNFPKLMSTVRQAYLRANHFEEIFDFLNQECAPQQLLTLADYNSMVIEKITRRIGNHKVEFVRCKNIPALTHSTLSKTELIVEVCKVFEITRYLTGEGCLDFLQPQQFTDAGIELRYQNFTHPVYTQIQTASFQPGLSILDALMNLGFKRTAELITRSF